MVVMTYIIKSDQMPSGEHWAIVRTTGVMIPGDERSRTNPGHGYPERMEYYLSYQLFTTEEEFREAFTKLLNSPYGDKQAKGIHVAATYSGKMQVVVEETS